MGEALLAYAALVLAGFKPWTAENLPKPYRHRAYGRLLVIPRLQDQRLSLPEALHCAGFSLAGMFLARKRQAIRSPKQTWALRDSVPCDDGECGSAALQSPSAKRFCPSFFLKPVFIVLAPLGHCFNDRAQGLPQIAQDIFHTGRHLRIDGAGKDTILFHRAEAVREHLLANDLQIPAQFIKAPGTLHQIADNQEFPLASDQLYGGATGQAGISSFVSIVPPHFLALTEILHSKILGNTAQHDKNGRPADEL